MTFFAFTSRLRRCIDKKLATFSFAVVLSVPAPASQSATLAWNPNSEPDLAGYKLYYGLASGIYTEIMDVGNTTITTVPDLFEGVRYYFVVTAYNTNNVESEPSNEVSFPEIMPPTNNSPTMAVPSNVFTPEDTAISIAVIIADLETPAAGLTLRGRSSNPALVPDTNIIIDGSGASRTVTLVPLTNASGTATITLTVSDGTATTSESLILTVASVSDPPTLDAFTDLALVQNAPNQTINLSGISRGAPHETTGTLLITATSSNPSLIPTPTVWYASPNATGTLIIDPADSGTGSSVITVTIDNGQASNNITRRTFVVRVRASANSNPTISSVPNRVTSEDVPVVIPITINDSLTSPSQLTVYGVSSNEVVLPNTNIVVSGTGSNRTVTLLPAPNQSGTTQVRLFVVDSAFGVGSNTFTLTVNQVNDPPVISKIPDLVINQNAIGVLVPFTVSDVESSARSLICSVACSNRVLIPEANILLDGSGTNRVLSLTPESDQSGSATLTVTVSDGIASRTETFVVTVNQLPVLTVLRNGPFITLSWPALPAPFLVEFVPRFPSPTLWTALTNTPVDVGSNKTVTLLATNDSSFYRLRSQD